MKTLVLFTFFLILAFLAIAYNFRHLLAGFKVSQTVDLIATANLFLNIVIVCFVTIAYNKRFSILRNQKDLVINAVQQLLILQSNEKEALENISGLRHRQSELLKNSALNQAAIADNNKELISEYSKAAAALTRIKNQRNLLYYLIKTSAFHRKAKAALLELHQKGVSYVTDVSRSSVGEVTDEQSYREWLIYFTQISEINMENTAMIINYINSI